MLIQTLSPKTQGFLFKVKLNNRKSIPKKKAKAVFDGFLFDKELVYI